MSIFGVIFTLFCAAAIWWAWRRHSTTDQDEGKCAHCGYDLRASIGRCPECGMPFRRPGDHVPLRDDWPADAITPRIPRPDETPVVIYRTDSQWEAATLRDQLEVRGIAAQVVDRPVIHQNAYLGLTTLGSWRVVVWSGDAELAATIRDRLIPHPPPSAIADDSI